MIFIINLVIALAYYPVFIVSLVQREREWLLHWFIFMLNAFFGTYGLCYYFGLF